MTGMQAWFQSGANLSAAEAEIMRQIAATDALLNQLRQRIPPSPQK
jgi:hypothetical protein